jgi:hypothetical protein
MHVRRRTKVSLALACSFVCLFFVFTYPPVQRWVFEHADRNTPVYKTWTPMQVENDIRIGVALFPYGYFLAPAVLLMLLSFLFYLGDWRLFRRKRHTPRSSDTSLTLPGPPR